MRNVLLLFSCIITGVVGDSVMVIGHKGEIVNITCAYESGYETNKKYLCKGTCFTGFKDIVVDSESPAKDNRFSLIDNTTARVFTVTITHLRTKDEGTYWCGVSTSNLFFDKYSEILLTIKLDKKITVQPTTGHTVQPTTHPISIKPSYFSTSALTLQPTSIKPTDLSLSSTASVVYISIGLTLILIGLLLALTVFCKKRKGGKKSSRVAQSGPSDPVSAVNTASEDTAQDVEYHDHEYQEIRELRPKNVNSTVTVYSTVQGPAVSTIYSTPKTSVDTTIYTIAEPPADTTIYTIAEPPVDTTI